MKLKFNHQDYQAQASNAVVRCFKGQAKGLVTEIIDRHETGLEVNIFTNRKLTIANEAILANLNQVQKVQGLELSKVLQGHDYTIEMETGTGKTYVYTKTIFELNKHYGWSKFIVMVPSIAIREGVYKSFQITAEHFYEQYGKQIRFFTYDSKNKSNLVNIKNFADTVNIEVMIMNYQAFNSNPNVKTKDARKIYQELDSLKSGRPIDVIRSTNPILIIDEPQRFGPKAEKILSDRVFNQLFTLRYSATHKKDKEFNKIYRLDAIDAYNQRLVKKINVKGIKVVNSSGSESYLFLDKIEISKDKYPLAKLEIEVKNANSITKKVLSIKLNDNLYEKSKGLQQYHGYIVSEINAKTNLVSFSNGESISVGQAMGELNEEHYRRIQIRETIKSHLEKERVMFSKGIKVLSLFFIDEVSKYRQYQDSQALKGEYAKIFEEEYNLALVERNIFEDKYNQYLDRYTSSQVHNGYFSIDKKTGNYVNQIGTAKKELEQSTDTNAYDLIMKDKERLLSLDEPTRFIFSHSALREGWDNPNIFQICTLKHAQSTISKRQEIGRGLRICVNSEGERMDSSILNDSFHSYNTLTVIPSESYEDFASGLQNEIMKSIAGRPSKLTVEVLKSCTLVDKDNKAFTFNDTSAINLICAFKLNGYLDDDLKLTDRLFLDIKENKFTQTEVPDEFKNNFIDFLNRVNQTANYKPLVDARKDNVFREKLKPNSNFNKEEFKVLWSKIKQKTAYSVKFDSEKFRVNCIEEINNTLQVNRIMFNIVQGAQNNQIDDANIHNGDMMNVIRQENVQVATVLGSIKYDLIGEIEKNTQLTRKTIAYVLSKIINFDQFKINPQDFIEKVSDIMNEVKAELMKNSIEYKMLQGQYFKEDIFELNNVRGSLGNDIIEVKKHIYDYLKTDSKTEKAFAETMEISEVLVYAKLPRKFYIPTPVGKYSPDWAIVFNNTDNKFKHVYFIAETKGSMKKKNLKNIELAKIDFAKQHFKSLEDDSIAYDVVSNYDELMQKVLEEID
jgi:type III restriction enzyme